VVKDKTSKSDWWQKERELLQAQSITNLERDEFERCKAQRDKDCKEQQQIDIAWANTIIKAKDEE